MIAIVVDIVIVVVVVGVATFDMDMAVKVKGLDRGSVSILNQALVLHLLPSMMTKRLPSLLQVSTTPIVTTTIAPSLPPS